MNESPMPTPVIITSDNIPQVPTRKSKLPLINLLLLIISPVLGFPLLGLSLILAFSFVGLGPDDTQKTVNAMIGVFATAGILSILLAISTIVNSIAFIVRNNHKVRGWAVGIPLFIIGGVLLYLASTIAIATHFYFL